MTKKTSGVAAENKLNDVYDYKYCIRLEQKNFDRPLCFLSYSDLILPYGNLGLWLYLPLRLAPLRIFPTLDCFAVVLHPWTIF